MDDLRRRTESCDPNDSDTEGLRWWLERGEGGAKQGLSDVDLLRFVFFRCANFPFTSTGQGFVLVSWELNRKEISYTGKGLLQLEMRVSFVVRVRRVGLHM